MLERWDGSTSREVLALLCTAGRALAYAHAAGIGASASLGAREHLDLRDDAVDDVRRAVAVEHQLAVDTKQLFVIDRGGRR